MRISMGGPRQEVQIWIESAVTGWVESLLAVLSTGGFYWCGASIAGEVIRRGEPA